MISTTAASSILKSAGRSSTCRCRMEIGRTRLWRKCRRGVKMHAAAVILYALCSRVTAIGHKEDQGTCARSPNCLQVFGSAP